MRTAFKMPLACAVVVVLCVFPGKAYSTPTKYEVIPTPYGEDVELVRMPEIKAIIIQRTETAEEARKIAKETDCQAFWDKDGTGVVICGAEITGTLTAVGFDSD